MSPRPPSAGAERPSVGVVAIVASLALLVAIFSLVLAAGHARKHGGVPSAQEALVLALAIPAVLSSSIVGLRLSAEWRDTESRTARVAAAMRRLERVHGFARTVAVALAELRAASLARDVLFVAEDAGSGEAFLWEAGEAGVPFERAHRLNLEGDAGRDHLVECRCEAWLARQTTQGRWAVLELDAHGRSHRGARSVQQAAVERLAVRHHCRTLAGVRVDRDAWRAVVLVLDPSVARGARPALLLAQRLVAEAAGLARSRFHLGTLRARVGAAERARVARELHDGTIQALLGIEMEVAVLRRNAEARGIEVASDLARVQSLLREEVVALRDTMNRLRPAALPSEQLVACLERQVARFARQSGIAASFQAPAGRVELDPHVCREMVSIVAEALRNVQRHSGAGRALVRLVPGPRGGWELTVEDDGRGFAGIEDAWDLARLERTGQGPFTIKERARALGADLAVSRSAIGGARLALQVPGGTL